MILIVDDNQENIFSLKSLLVLNKFQVDTAMSGEESLKKILQNSYSLIILDVQMPDMDGFDVVGALSSHQNAALPHIIFTTAYDQYAVRAFEVHAIDYLLKPFTPDRLRSAVQRVRERMLDDGPKGSARDAESSSGGYTTRIVFKSRGRILFLSVEDIRWIGAEENYVRICTGGESHLLRETMGHLEARLDPQTFLRVHRSSIVNLRYVKEVKSEADGEATVVLTSGEKIAMSRSYRSRIQKLLH